MERAAVCRAVCCVAKSAWGCQTRKLRAQSLSKGRPTCTKSRGGPGDDPGIGQWGHFCSGSHPEQLDSAPTCRFPPACSIVPFLHILAPLFLCFPCRCGCRWQRGSRLDPRGGETHQPRGPENASLQHCRAANMVGSSGSSAAPRRGFARRVYLFPGGAVPRKSADVSTSTKRLPAWAATFTACTVTKCTPND